MTDRFARLLVIAATIAGAILMVIVWADFALGQGFCSIDPITGQKICTQQAAPQAFGGGAARGTFRTANFIVTAPDAETARKVAEWSEAYRTQHWQDFFGTDPPGNWPEPVQVEFVLQQGNGGATSIFIDNGRFLGAAGKWQGSGPVSQNVVPHEVMHTVLHSGLAYHPPRWLDEGLATFIERPEDQAQWFALAHDQLNSGQARPVRELCAEANYSPQTYPQGTALVTMLVGLKPGKRGIVELARIGRDQGWDAAFRQVYQMTPEQVDVAYCRWLRSEPRGGRLRRWIGGVVHAFTGGRWMPEAQQPAMQSPPQAPQQPVTLVPVKPVPPAAQAPAVATPPDNGRVAALEATLERLERELGKQKSAASVQTLPNANTPSAPSSARSTASAPEPSGAGGWIATLLGARSGAAIGTALLGPGIGTAVGIGGTLALGWLKRRRSRSANVKRYTLSSDGRLSEVEGSARPAPQIVPVAVDTKPTPARLMPETHVVEVPDNAFARAYQWGCEQVVRKYPGAEDTVVALDSLIKQQLTATQ